MNTRAIQRFRRKLAADEPVFGLWVTLEAPSITEMAVGLGMDWVLIDAEHGHLDFKEIAEHCRAAVRSETVFLVRIASLDRGLIKRVLDIGADGIIVPWVETADQVREALSYALYPPLGQRGVGAERATAWCEAIPQHTAEANAHVIVIPLLESARAGENIQEIAAVDGITACFFGPHDWAGSVGALGEWGGGEASRQIAESVGVLREKDRPCGIVAVGPEAIQERIAQGYRMIAVGIDGLLMLRSLHEALRSVGRDSTLDASLRVHADVQRLGSATVRSRPIPTNAGQASQVFAQGEGRKIEINGHVAVEFMAGGHSECNALSAGFVEFAPGGALPRHTHPFTEVLIVLEGQVESNVAGRRYELAPGDGAAIPSGNPHMTTNIGAGPMRAFIVMGTGELKIQTDADAGEYPMLDMPPDSQGVVGAERVWRGGNRRHELCAGVELEVFCDEVICPDANVCLAWITLAPGATLPRHAWACDVAYCVVEGGVSLDGAALGPGQVAYAFANQGRELRNDSDAPARLAVAGGNPVVDIAIEGALPR